MRAILSPTAHSLDRTNVVQSQLAKWVLNNQLRQVGILSTKESIDEHPAFLHMFRNGENARLRTGTSTFVYVLTPLRPGPPRIWQSGPTMPMSLVVHTLEQEHSRLTTRGMC